MGRFGLSVRVRGIAEAFNYPFVIATARWLIICWLISAGAFAHTTVAIRTALAGYGLITMLFASGWLHGRRALGRDDYHPLALPAIIVIDVFYAALVAKTSGVTLLCMLPALDVAILDPGVAFLVLAGSDAFLAATAIHFQGLPPFGTVMHVLGMSIGPYLAAAYGLHGRFRAEQQFRAVDQMLHASSEIGTQLSLHDVLVQLMNLLRQFRRVVPWDTAVIYVVEFDDSAREDTLFAVETAGLRARAYEGRRAPFGAGVVGFACSKQRPALVADLHKDAREAESDTAGGERSAIVVPIVADNQTFGCVQLLSGKPNFYTVDQLGLIGRLINLASVGVRNALLHSRTRAMADLDGLTGLLTNRAYHERLEGEFRRAQAGKKSLSLLLVDVDNFKDINDTHGHPAGDELLRYVGAMLRQHARKNDWCCRYGGDEFVVIMPETIKSDAATVADRIRTAIEAHVLAFENRQLRTTVSIGVASYPQDVTTKVGLVKAADAALYAAKQNGRNALRVFRAHAMS